MANEFRYLLAISKDNKLAGGIPTTPGLQLALSQANPEFRNLPE